MLSSTLRAFILSAIKDSKATFAGDKVMQFMIMAVLKITLNQSTLSFSPNYSFMILLKLSCL